MKVPTNKRGIKLHVREFVEDEGSPNIIFCCTPLMSVDDLESCFRPFYGKGFNVFAFDFAGTGKSGGESSDFTIEGILDDFESLVDYIKSKTSGIIYVFADAGIGGIIGQYCISGETEIKGFAQFAVGIYRDIPSLKVPTALVATLLPLIKALRKVAPKLCLTMKPPKYEGHNAEVDNFVYAKMLEENKDAFRVSTHFLCVLLEMFTSKNSRLRHMPSIPTLVFKTRYDRYFSAEYFDQYFEALSCRKKLCVIEDVHNSYLLYPELFADEVADWFLYLEA